MPTIPEDRLSSPPSSADLKTSDLISILIIEEWTVSTVHSFKQSSLLTRL